jgi:hypothetical protein
MQVTPLGQAPPGLAGPGRGVGMGGMPMPPRPNAPPAGRGPPP